MPRSRSAFLPLILVTAVLAGCVDDAPVPGLASGEVLYTLPLTINVVPVGFDDFDAARLYDHLDDPIDVFPWIKADQTARRELEPLQYDVEYVVHDEPSALAEDLFAYAATTMRQRAPDAWLVNYDRDGQERICRDVTFSPLAVLGSGGPDCEDVNEIDAAAVEAWLHDNRADYGLDFDGAQYTVFILDSYSQAHLPQETYNQYYVEDGSTSQFVRNMRAWGGAHDFVFFDIGAGPNSFDHRPWANYSSSGPELYEYTDDPVWDLAGADDLLYENMGRNVFDAVQVLWARLPIYPVQFAERYYVPIYVVVDPNARTNPDSPLRTIDPADLPANTDEEAIAQAFADLAPWADVTTEFHYLYLPDDDPGMAEAVKDARSRYYGEDSLDTGVLKKYLNDNFEHYAPAEPGRVEYPVFAFWSDLPSYSIYGYADADHIGESWGVFINVADAALCLNRGPLCTPEDYFGSDADWWTWWNALIVHEVGHSYGLTHTHDTAGLDPDHHTTTYNLNWLWDSTSSVMTYRHVIPAFNQFDRDQILRMNTGRLAEAVMTTSPPATVTGQIEDAWAAMSRGDYEGALGHAIDAWRAAGSPVPDQSLGTRGETQEFHFEFAAGRCPGGWVPDPVVWQTMFDLGVPYAVWGPVYSQVFYPKCLPAQVVSETYEFFDIHVPHDAKALEIEYREVDAPSHQRWMASVIIFAPDIGAVAYLTNNGHDRTVLLEPDLCRGGCTGAIYAFGGVAPAYDVWVTPYT